MLQTVIDSEYLTRVLGKLLVGTWLLLQKLFKGAGGFMKPYKS